MSHEERFKKLNIELPEPPSALGVYRFISVVENTAYLTGHGPTIPGGPAICGHLGQTLDKEAGYEAARRTGLNILATLRNHFGSLDVIGRLVKTTGFVNATPGFTDHPAVINGFSELMRDVFGDGDGVGVRSAVGVASLPANWAVEIEAIFELKPAT